MATTGDTVSGVLPLAWLKSRLFGNFISSIPFFTGGGIAAVNNAVEYELLSAGINLTKRIGADFLELRHRSDHALMLPVKTDKTLVLVPLSEPDQMWKRLDKRTRYQIRKGTNLGLSATIGGAELLDDFYTVFAENMRDLGTPVYSRRFFAEILNAFPDQTFICAVRYQDRTVASSFLNGYRDVLESCWAASKRQYLFLKPNMFLTWNAFCLAARKGYRVFDFGRSTAGTGAHAYKLQWTGAESFPLYWTYWMRKGHSIPTLHRHNPRYQFAIRLWQKLPVSVTLKVGPKIVRYLP